MYGEEGSRFFVVCFLHTSQRYIFDLDIELSTSPSRAKPMSLYDHLENNIWIYGVWGDRLPGCLTHFLQSFLFSSVF